MLMLYFMKEDIYRVLQMKYCTSVLNFNLMMTYVVFCKSNMYFNFLQEVPGMGFEISQLGSSVATSLIDGESKLKHVLLLEIKVVNLSM